MGCLKMTEFFAELDPVEYFSEILQDYEKPIEFSELDFTFAVAAIDESIGKIVVNQVDWSSGDGLKLKTPISMVPCEFLMPLELPLVNS